MANSSIDIVRYSGDTYPNKSTIKINGVPVDIAGWNVELRYMRDDGEVRTIDCVVTDATNGKVSIYPHSRPADGDRITTSMFVTDEMEATGTEAATEDPNTQSKTTSNQCFNKGVEAFTFSIVRTREYDGYVERMTHNVGTISILGSV